MIDLFYNYEFSKSTIGGVSNPYTIYNGFSVINRYFQLYSLLPVIILFLIFHYIKNPNDNVSKISSFFAFFVFLFACLTSMKFGAWVNYFSLFNIIGLFLVSLYINSQKINLYHFKFISLLFLIYFTSGITFHFLSPEFKFDNSKIEKITAEINKLKQNMPSNSRYYTNIDVIELVLYDKSFFPNQVFYPELSTFKYKIDSKIYKNLFVIKQKGNSFDFVESSILKLNKNNTRVVQTFMDYEVIEYKSNN